MRQRFGFLPEAGIRELGAVFQEQKRPAKGSERKNNQNVEPQERFSYPRLSFAPADDVNAALQRIQTTLENAAQVMVDQAIAIDPAVLFELTHCRRKPRSKIAALACGAC